MRTTVNNIYDDCNFQSKPVRNLTLPFHRQKQRSLLIRKKYKQTPSKSRVVIPRGSIAKVNRKKSYVSKGHARSSNLANSRLLSAMTSERSIPLSKKNISMLSLRLGKTPKISVLLNNMNQKKDTSSVHSIARLSTATKDSIKSELHDLVENQLIVYTHCFEFLMSWSYT
jgi:hypothetical protein